jgi:DNA-binding Lrp family transcriptional regulator
LHLDELDIDILKVLEQDARISYRKISEDLNISVGTVHNRIAKLKEQGIIKGYLLDLSEEKLEYNLKVIISLTIKGTKIEGILKELSKNRSVTNIYSVSGNFSAVLMCRFKTMSDYRDFNNYLNAQDAIRQMETNIVLDVFKEDLHHLLSTSED